MFIKNINFRDEDSLLEQLFDFSLGDAEPEVQQLMTAIDEELKTNTAFQEYRATLTDEEDIQELDAEERLIRLAEQLMERYTSFQTEQNKLYGLKDGNRTLLYTIDLY